MYARFIETPSVQERRVSVPPHTRLGISLPTYLALIETRNELDTKKLKKARYVGRIVFRGGFDMSTWNSKGFSLGMCDTCKCIGGSIQLKIGDLLGIRDKNAMYDLFYPDIQRRLWSRITPDQAVRAIDNWIANGDPDWVAVTGYQL